MDRVAFWDDEKILEMGSGGCYTVMRMYTVPLNLSYEPYSQMFDIMARERNPQIPAPTPHKVLGPGIDGREIPKGSRATRMRTGLS